VPGTLTELWFMAVMGPRPNEKSIFTLYNLCTLHNITRDTIWGPRLRHHRTTIRFEAPKSWNHSGPRKEPLSRDELCPGKASWCQQSSRILSRGSRCFCGAQQQVHWRPGFSSFRSRC
jgi:hypothetical protein